MALITSRSGVVLHDDNLSLRETLISVRILPEAYLYNCDLSNIDLSGANLSGADLQHADLSHSDLSKANLFNINLSYSNLGNVNLSNVNLHNADLQHADLSGADLQHADLSYANLSYANLSYANLSYANLQNANLRGANITRAYLKRTKLEGAVFKEIKWNPSTSITSSELSPIQLLQIQPMNQLLYETGDICAYKIVTNDYRGPFFKNISDCYDTIGKTYTVNVYELSLDVSCGSGLNVGTLQWCINNWDDYLKYRLLKVKFRAEDIVAIPTFSEGKYRVKSFTVVEEMTHEFLKKFGLIGAISEQSK